MRQELQREHGVTVSLRTVERAVMHLRREVLAQTAAAVRFETPPGHQLQIDFGTVRVPIADAQVKVHLFVATLGYSRRTFTQRPFPPAGSCGMMLSLALESRAAVDAINEVAAAHGGQADVNPMEDHGFMYTRDLADPDGHMWAALWMDPAAMPAASN